MKYLYLAIITLALVGTASAANFNITAKDVTTNASLTNFTATLTVLTTNITIGLCYQETATVANSCGALSTGSYSTEPYYVTMNYSKPIGATEAVWMTKEGPSGVSTINTTLPTACFSANTNYLLLRGFSNRTAGIARFECYNGTGWYSVTDYLGAGGPAGSGNDSSVIYDGDFGTFASYVSTDNSWKTSSSFAGANIWEEGIYWNITNSSYPLTTLSYSTTNGTIGIYNTSILSPANITVSADNYLSSTILNANTNVSQVANLSSYNIYATIYDELTGLRLNTTTVSLQFSTDQTYSTATTTNGTYNFTQAINATYTIKASATNYNQRTYTLVFSDSTNNISLYLSNSTANVTFTVKDKAISTVLLQNATITMARLINNTWTTIETLNTDIVGSAILQYTPLATYLFTVSRNDYTTKTFYLDPIQYDSYDILLDKITQFDNQQDFSNVQVLITPTQYINNQTSTLYFTIASPTDALTSYSVNASYPGGTNISIGSTASGEVLSLSLNINSTLSLDYVNVTFSYTTNLASKTFRRQYPIVSTASTPNFSENTDNTYGLGDFERAGIATATIAMFSALGFLYAGAIGGGAIALLFLAFFTKIGFFNEYAVIGSLLVGMAIIFWRSSE